MADILPLRPPVADPPADLDAHLARLRDRPEPSAELLVVDAHRLAAMLCAGVRTVRTWDAAGKLPKPLKIGGRVVWRVDEIRAWLAAGTPDRETWEARRAAWK